MKTAERSTRTMARPGRPPKARRVENIRDRLLDVAEELFAEGGLQATTLKQIAHRANVTTALLHYYFQDKQGLLESVFSRRLNATIDLRMQALERYERETGPQMTLEGVMVTFIRPWFQAAIDGGASWRNYLAVVAQVNNTPGWGAEIMAKIADASIQRCVALLRQVYPQAPQDDLYWCFLQLSGSVTLTLAQTGRIDRWSNGSCRSDDLQTASAKLLAYAIGGFRAVCEAPCDR